MARIVERRPSVAEYIALIESVGFRPRDPKAVAIALENSIYAVCAVADGGVVGCGRVIGDGALHYYLTDVIVRPECRQRGIGSSIVASLTSFVEAVPYRNTVVGILPLPGLARFYGRHGYEAQGPDAPAMVRWINRTPSGQRTENGDP